MFCMFYFITAEVEGTSSCSYDIFRDEPNNSLVEVKKVRISGKIQKISKMKLSNSSDLTSRLLHSLLLNRRDGCWIKIMKGTHISTEALRVQSVCTEALGVHRNPPPPPPPHITFWWKGAFLLTMTAAFMAKGNRVYKEKWITTTYVAINSQANMFVINPGVYWRIINTASTVTVPRLSSVSQSNVLYKRPKCKILNLGRAIRNQAVLIQKDAEWRYLVLVPWVKHTHG